MFYKSIEKSSNSKALAYDKSLLLYKLANATILEAVIRKFAALPDCCHMLDGKLLFRSLLDKLVKLA